jgi:hypothetical protein
MGKELVVQLGVVFDLEFVRSVEFKKMFSEHHARKAAEASAAYRASLDGPNKRARVTGIPDAGLDDPDGNLSRPD